MISLAAGHVRLDLDPVHGGRIASLSIADRELLVGPAADRGPMEWGSYPLVPFGGRIRGGRFRFADRTVALPATFHGHAIHGTGYRQPWTVDEAGADHVGISCRFTPDWPFGGSARQRWELTPRAARGTLSVTAGDQAMPAQVGWHPWFVKPDALEFAARAMYRRDEEGIAVDELIAVPNPPWDDCFVGVEQPVVLRWGDLAVALRSDCDHWVVFDHPLHATCVEPMSGPPDGFTLRPARLAPGETLERWFELSW